MTKNIRKVGLLKDSKPTPKTTPQTSNAQTGLISENSGATTSSTIAAATSTSVAGKILGKLLIYTSVILVLALIVLPKPELLRYQKMNTVATSIYWPGAFGIGEGLVDSNLAVYIDNSRQELNLCYELQQEQQCSRYQILHRGGLIDVILHLLSS